MRSWHALPGCGVGWLAESAPAMAVRGDRRSAQIGGGFHKTERKDSSTASPAIQPQRDRPVDQAEPCETIASPGGGVAPLLRAREGAMLRWRAGVAEWQTRQTQNLLSDRTWEFKSPRPHQSGQ